MTTNPLIEHLRRRIEEKKKELADAEQQLAAAQRRREIVAKDLGGYQHALEAEMRTNGTGTTKVDDSTLNEFGPGDQSQDSETPDPQENRTEFVRHLVRSHPTSGITPAQIYLQFQKASVEMHRNYVYSMLKRLVESGEVKVVKGKYFPLEKGSEQVAALE